MLHGTGFSVDDYEAKLDVVLRPVIEWRRRLKAARRQQGRARRRLDGR